MKEPRSLLVLKALKARYCRLQGWRWLCYGQEEVGSREEETGLHILLVLGPNPISAFILARASPTLSAQRSYSQTPNCEHLLFKVVKPPSGDCQG